MRKLIFLVLFLSPILLLSFSLSYAVSENDFALSIVHDGNPVREIDKGVAIPFDTEYKIRLKNGHDRKCTAKVFIDGALVSKLGDFILDSKGEIDLERFLDSSLTEGRRFKFVRLDHPDVDDPTRAQNGLVRVEFRLEKVRYLLKFDDEHLIIPNDDMPPLDYWYKWDSEEHTIRPMSNYTSDTSVFCSNNSATEPGATVAGSESDQTFHHSHIDVEDRIYALELRMVGITQLSLAYP